MCRFLKGNPVLPVLCYAILLGVFVLDLFTPQLFVASILLNVPIALSSLALRGQLTISLIVAAEAANAVAGYVNGMQAGAHFDAVAVGDRVLLAASFLLVGYMTLKTQDLARTAGLSDARVEQAQRERSLRLGLERVRASLSVELVLRAVAREAAALFAAKCAMLLPDSAAPDDTRYVARASDVEVTVEQQALPAEVRSLLARPWEGAAVLGGEITDTIARYALEALRAEFALIAPLRLDERDVRLLLLLRDGKPWARDDVRFLQSFADQSAIAVAQARLFERVAGQADQIAAQHQAMLERSNVIRDLVYALAHDLRTPLAAADVTMQQAKAGAYGLLPDAYKDVLDTTLRSNQELQRMVETLLLVARYESGEASAIRAPVDLSEIARQVGAELDAAARARGVELSVDGNPALVLGDAGELKRASINLAGNAIAATAAGGHIRIATRANVAAARIEIEDDGFGVPAERRPGLFQRFGGATAPRGGGTGLGLYIVRLIAEKHGGAAYFEPLAPGSRFGLSLPSAPERGA